MKLDMRKKQEKKESTKVTKKLPMTAKMKCAMAVYIVMVLIMTAGASTVFAADDPLTVINNLSTFIFGLIRAIGMILLGFGIVQVGLSLKSHDPSQRAKFYRGKKTGTRIENFYTLCDCKRCSHVWIGIDDGTF